MAAHDDRGSSFHQKEFSLSMIRDYIQAAMRHAKYEILSEDKSYYGEVPKFRGVYANAATLEQCREILEEILEEWIFFRISRNLSLPVIDRIKLEIKKAG